jgi:hypothetical protein
MIRRYPGEPKPYTPNEGKRVPRAQWIEVLSNKLKISTSPYGTDAPTSTDYYYNTSYIDAELNAIKARLTALESRATSLEGRATSLEGRATNLEGRSTNLEGRATNVEKRASTLETRSTTLETKTEILDNRTTTVEMLVNPPVITSSGSNRTGVVGGSFTYQIAATNTPTNFSAKNLPPGITVNTSTGLISGTFTQPYDDNVTVSASNPGGTGSKTFKITVT